MLENVLRVDRKCGGCRFWVTAKADAEGTVTVTDRDGRLTVEAPGVTGVGLERLLDSRTYWSLKAHRKRVHRD